MTDQEFWQDKRVLVTGGAGFIGSHLVEELTREGAQVTVIDDLSTGHRDNLLGVAGKITLQKLDICHVAWPELLGDRYDVVFHLAGNAYVPPSVERPGWDFQSNLQATFRLVEALRQMQWPGRLIYASSAAVYGNPARLPICEEDPTLPVSPYGVAKLAAERYVAVYSQLYGLKGASLRLFSLYGPRQRKQVVYDLIEKIVRNPGELPIYGDGTQVRDFNYVEETVRAAMLVAKDGALRGEVYNVASGLACTIRELAESLCRVLDVQPRFVYSGSVRPGDAQRWTVNIARLTALGYLPEMSLEQGLRRTVEWFRTKPPCGREKGPICKDEW